MLTDHSNTPPACVSQGRGRSLRETITQQCGTVRLGLYGQQSQPASSDYTERSLCAQRARACPRTRAFEHSMPGRCQRVAHCAWRGGKTTTRTRHQCALRGARKQPCVRARLGRDALALPRRLLLLCVAVAAFALGTAQLARCRSCPARRAMARRLMAPSRCCAGGPVACARRDRLMA